MITFAQYLADLDFYRRHFMVVNEPVKSAALHPWLSRNDVIGFWLHHTSREGPDLIAVVTLLKLTQDDARVGVWFYRRWTNSRDWSDYFIGVPSYNWTQVWPGEDKELTKVLLDAITMEALAGNQPQLNAGY